MAAAVLLAGNASRLTSAAAISVAALFALACWDAVTLAWAPNPSLGRDESLLVLTGALAFAAVALSATGRHSRLAVAGMLALLSASTALAMGVIPLVDDFPADLYHDGRLEAPIGYTNALAALFLLGFWPALAIGAHPSIRWPVRAAAFGGAAAMLAGEIQAQSKGAGVGLVLAGAVVVAVSPLRFRLLVPGAIVAACVLPAAHALTAPFRSQQAERAAQPSSIRDAAVVLLLVAAVATLAGLVYVFAEPRVTIPAKVRRWAALTAAATVAIAAVGGAVWAATSADRIERWTSARWDEFTESSGQQLESSSNFGSLGSSRYDSWSVAAHEFADHPVAGSGARSFRAAYLEHGKTQDTPERSHSLLLDVLGETGLIGFALLVAAVAPPLWLMARRARRSLVEASLFAAALAWITHASVDWIWTLPAVSLPFFVLLAAGSSADEHVPVPPRVSLASAAAAVAIAVAVFVPPWLSVRFTERALAGGRPDSQAYTWARRLDPLAIEPLLAEAELARTPVEAVAVLGEAVRKEPESAALHYFLGLELERAGRRDEALRELERARRLYPRGPEINDALRSLRAGG